MKACMELDIAVFLPFEANLFIFLSNLIQKWIGPEIFIYGGTVGDS